MRFTATATSALVLAASIVASAAYAADLPTRTAPAVFTPMSQPTPSILSEVRFGVTAHDPFSPEKGSVDINGEVLFSKFFRSDNAIIDLLIPRLHVGGSVNTAGKTSYAYAGFTWNYDITKEIFVEATFGGAFHNGETGDFVQKHRNSLGCSPLFRESAAIGYRLTDNWSIMATVDHMSNAGLCDQNRGLTNVGAKIGYTF
jgi:Lipid A 3-O-deacylase (PagL).